MERETPLLDQSLNPAAPRNEVSGIPLFFSLVSDLCRQRCGDITLPPDFISGWGRSQRAVVAFDFKRNHGRNRTAEWRSRNSSSMSIFRPHRRHQHRRLDSHHAWSFANGAPPRFRFSSNALILYSLLKNVLQNTCNLRKRSSM